MLIAQWFTNYWIWRMRMLKTVSILSFGETINMWEWAGDMKRDADTYYFGHGECLML